MVYKRVKRVKRISVNLFNLCHPCAIYTYSLVNTDAQLQKVYEVVESALEIA